MAGALWFFLGLAILVVGAEVVVRGTSRLALSLGISPLLLGLTVVSIGTSAPELAVGITASLEGAPAIAVGNIAGTNVLNLLFILGLAALLRPIPLQLRILRLELPTMVVAAALMTLLAWDGVLGTPDGLVLLAGAVIYTLLLARQTRSDTRQTREALVDLYGAEPRDAVPSAPELATTLVATVRNERDVAVGNLIGSSIYNILFILGLTCVALPGDLPVDPDLLTFDIPLMAGVALLCVPVFISGRGISRWEGGAFVAMYLGYLGYLLSVRATF